MYDPRNYKESFINLNVLIIHHSYLTNEKWLKMWIWLWILMCKAYVKSNELFLKVLSILIYIKFWLEIY